MMLYLSFGLWALGFGLWALGFGLWALGFGQEEAHTCDEKLSCVPLIANAFRSPAAFSVGRVVVVIYIITRSLAESL